MVKLVSKLGLNINMILAMHFLIKEMLLKHKQYPCFPSEELVLLQNYHRVRIVYLFYCSFNNKTRRDITTGVLLHHI